MSLGPEKFAVAPSKGAMVQMKAKLLSSQKSYSLLKRKVDALNFKVIQLVRKQNEIKEKFIEHFRDAQLTFAKTKFFSLNLFEMVRQKKNLALLFIKVLKTSTSDMNLPELKLVCREPKTFPLVGLGRGGQQVSQVRVHFQEILKMLVELASSQYACKVLEITIRQTKRRMNAMQLVIIPRIRNTMTYIERQLEESEREELFRIKLIKKKQMKVSSTHAVISSTVSSPEFLMIYFRSDSENDILF